MRSLVVAAAVLGVGCRGVDVGTRPDPAVVHAVPVDGDPALGPATAKVTIVFGGDFACAFCLRAAPVLGELRRKYGDDVRIVWKHFVAHPVARTPALAACAAQRQDRFFELAQLIWEKSWQNGSIKDLSEAAMVEHARSLGLDLDRFSADMKSAACKELLAGDQAALAAAGQSDAPAFFVNGRFVSGSPSIEGFRQIIDVRVQPGSTMLARPEGSSRTISFFKLSMRPPRAALLAAYSAWPASP